MGIILGILALFSGATETYDPAAYVTEFVLPAIHSTTTVTPEFSGLTWACGDETCYAGLSDGRLTTGP